MKDDMNMPGFTADASLYKPRRHYSLGVSRGADGQVVIPQRAEIPLIWLMPYAACFYGCWAGGGGAVECERYCKAEWR